MWQEFFLKFFNHEIERKMKSKVRLKILNQGLIEKIKSKSAENFLIKVWLQKVKHLYTNLQNHSTPEDCTGARYFNQGPVENFESRSG